jgi:hypothetical protein
MPNEVFSSLLAATTAFIGGNLLNLPVWGIFIGWAVTYLAGGPNRATVTKLWPAMAAGRRTDAGYGPGARHVMRFRPPCSAASDFFPTIRSPRGCPQC